MIVWDYMLDPPDELEPPEWAQEEIGGCLERIDEINNLLRDYEALVNKYNEANETSEAEKLEDEIMDLEEERYECQMRIAELEDPDSEIYQSYPEE